jgi:hypothetical protein
LFDALAELLGAAEVRRAGHSEVGGREAGQSGEADCGFVGVEGVADAQCGGVDQADDAIGVRGVQCGALSAEDLLDVLGGERFAGGGVGDHHAALEHGGADAGEGDLVAVRGVHAGVNWPSRRSTTPRTTLTSR